MAQQSSSGPVSKTKSKSSQQMSDEERAFELQVEQQMKEAQAELDQRSCIYLPDLNELKQQEEQRNAAAATKGTGGPKAAAVIQIISICIIAFLALVVTMPIGVHGRSMKDTVGALEPILSPSLSHSSSDAAAATESKYDELFGDLHSFVDSESGPYALNAHWENNVVKYRWDPNRAANDAKMVAAKAEFRAAMQDWSSQTCIRFEETNNPVVGQPLVVLGYKTDGSSESVGFGRTARECNVVVSPANVVTKKARHELGHVLGLGHTQSRADRDKYLTVDVFPGGGCEREYCADISPEYIKGLTSVMCNNLAQGFNNPAIWNKKLTTFLSRPQAMWKPYQQQLQWLLDHSPPLADSGLQGDALTQARETLLRQACARVECMKVVKKAVEIDQQRTVLTTPYDANSVMHYGLNQCLSPKNGVQQQRVVDAIQPVDYEAINQIYGCGSLVSIDFRTRGIEMARLTVRRYIYPSTITLAQLRPILQRYIRWRHSEGDYPAMNADQLTDALTQPFHKHASKGGEVLNENTVLNTIQADQIDGKAIIRLMFV